VLKGPGQLLRIRPGIFDLEPDLSSKLGQTQPPQNPARYQQIGTQRFRTILG
jgi:hypothetical protein